MTIPEAFIAQLAPIAKDVMAKYKVPASVCIAQACLETGYGQHAPGNNYFGIKATTDNGGKTIEKPTLEFLNNTWVTVMADFCSYPDLATSADAYGKFLNTNQIYSRCFNFQGAPFQFTFALQTAGYATDPKYAQKLNSIIKQFNLTQYDVQ